MRPPFAPLALTALVLACGPTAAERQAAAARARADSIARAAAAPLPGMPPIDSTDVYAAAAAGMVDSVEAAGRPAVYVPLGGGGGGAGGGPPAPQNRGPLAPGAPPHARRAAPHPRRPVGADDHRHHPP